MTEVVIVDVGLLVAVCVIVDVGVGMCKQLQAVEIWAELKEAIGAGKPMLACRFRLPPTGVGLQLEKVEVLCRKSLVVRQAW